MVKLGKSTMAQTFKFDCDRYLRFKLASDEERARLEFEEEKSKRPGIQLMTAAGRRWEADKYQDLIDVAGAGSVEHVLGEYDDSIDRERFGKVANLFDVLRRDEPPLAVLEGEFTVPVDVTPGYRQACEEAGLEPVGARPDIMWIRRYPSGAPLVEPHAEEPEYEIHIVDVKMAAEPSLRHFAEVTFYALALAAALRKEGLSERYAVSAEGFIWPGHHDANAFRNLHRDATANGAEDPVTAALLETLRAVPYEVYQVHVRQFFEGRLLRVLGQEPLEADWHVGSRSQLCDYLPYCIRQARDEDHLSRVPGINRGQAEILRDNGIATTADLAAAIEEEAPEWEAVREASPQLRAEGPALLARSRALGNGNVETVEGRRTALMPRWSNMSVFLTVHFDPGSGIAFSMGASRIYFPPDREEGAPPITDEQVFIVDRVDGLNPETERARLVEFVDLISTWLLEAHDANERIRAERRGRGERDSAFGKVSAHVFFWDGLEVTQLRRMIERHMDHPDVVEAVELLARLFPPEEALPDPTTFRSQPGTVVKDALKLLVGLPLPHDYALMDVANVFYPNVREDGEPYRFSLPFGFYTDMSDQIPFERAYELWEDRVFLSRAVTGRPGRRRRYYRHEIFSGIERATLTRMRALRHVVRKFREHHGEQLVLVKPPFSAARPPERRVPQRARSLIAFEELNVACDELENRQKRSLPVDEREARFISIRGLRPATEQPYPRRIDELRTDNPRYALRDLEAFTFPPTSSDARIKEGDFLVALSNEEPALDLDLPWRRHQGLSYDEARELLTGHGLRNSWMVNLTLGRLVQVEVARLAAAEEPPYLILTPSQPDLYRFALRVGLLDFDRPMVIDPIYRDFTSGEVEATMRAVGGNAPRSRRTRS
ncbi:MAG: hypothetical protein M3R38_04290 [Actinomycetota bacterium]|nr:hypothetical protein [Actinomycetota bacterium]